MRSFLCRKPATLLLLLIPFGLAVPAARCQAESAPAQSAQAKVSKHQPAKDTAQPETSLPSYHEDFSILPVDKSTLKLEMAVLGEKDDNPNFPFIRERWHLLWRPGDPIDVYIIKPRGVEKPPVVLYLYSFPQDTDRFKQDTWCGYATGNGFAAVGFVSALTGHRLENRAPKEDFFNQLPESLGGTVHDVQMILNYLASRGDLDLTRVGMFGQGSGGAIAILVSSVDPRIKALDLLTPWGDWPVFAAQSTFVPSEDRSEISKPDFQAKVASLDPLRELPKVKALSIRIQNIRGDRHMPDDAQLLLESVAPPNAEIDQFGDAAALVPAAVNGKLLDWIKSRLAPDAKPQAAMDKSERVHFYPPKMTTPALDEDVQKRSAEHPTAAPQ